MRNSSTAKLPPVADLFRNILLDMTAKEEDIFIHTTNSLFMAQSGIFLSPRIHSTFK